MVFNPIVSITGNGVLGQVTATYYIANSDWIIETKNNPGQVLTGSFPNSKNLYSIQTSTVSLQFPYRGGKNLANSDVRPQLSNFIVGVSSVGLSFYGPSAGILITGLNGTKWNINEPVANVLGSDIYSGNTDPTGTYQYRDGRFIKNNAWGSITGSTWAGGNYRQTDGHSKIVGWARDGYPIYGPYGYSTATNVMGGVSRMISGYQLDIKANRPIVRNLVVSRSVSSSFFFSVYSVVGLGIGMDLSGPGITTSTRIINILGTVITVDARVTFLSGDILTGSFANGIFIEDWSHYQTTSTLLDVYNGRFCVTPEFPNGTYAYFVTLDLNNNPTYPYMVGPYLYGALRSDDTNTTLLNLIPSSGTLDPSFFPDTRNYNILVDNNINYITLLPISSNVNSKIVVNASTVVSGTVSNQIPLIVGNTTSTIVVTSQYLTTGQYNITVNRLRNSNNNLKALSVVSNVLSSTFTPTVLTYNLTVNETIYSIDIIPTVDNNLSTIKINEVDSLSGQLNRVALSIGSNTINIVVTAEDTTTKTYIINATRLSSISLLSNIEVNTGTILPSFNSQTFFYDVTVPNNRTTIQAKGQLVDIGSSLIINGVITSSSQFSNNINLKTGINPIAFTINSSDGSTSHFYKINVFREFNTISSLEGISLSRGSLSPLFSSNITNYTASVSNLTTDINLVVLTSDSKSTIKINNIVALAGINFNVPLVVGTNTTPIRVIAENGVSETTYNINIIRAGSNVSTLNNLLVSNTTIYPPFSTNILSYTGTVEYSVLSTKVFPVSSEINSSITVNNVSVISGGSSPSITLNISANTITTKVISQNQLNSSTYTIVLTRKQNNDASLSSLYFDIAIPPIINPLDIVSVASPGIELNPPFSPTITNYSITRPHDVTSIKFVAFANDNNISSIKISNGISEIITTSGVANTIELLGEINGVLWNGLTQIKIKVTAADSISTQTYTLNVTRTPSTISTLSNLLVGIGPLSPDFSPTVTEYYYNVPYLTSSTTITASPSYSLQKIYTLIQNNYALIQSDISVPVNLIVGNNTIGILSYADDRITFTGYNIYVNRAGIGLNDNAFLSNITLSTGTYSPIFNKNIYLYSSTVNYDTTKIKILASKENSFANIKINNISVTSGLYSSDIDLAIGNNRIDIDVVAEDNASTKKYSIRIFRQGNTNSLLKELYVSYGQLDKLFSPYITEYIVYIPAQVNQVSVKPIVDDYQAVVGVNNVGVAAGQGWSDPKNVIVGNNLITIIITAGNRINRTIYTINFIKSSQPENNTPIVPIVPIRNTNIPQWITPKGFITTATEGQSVSSNIIATGTNVSYKIISGFLPKLLTLNTVTGLISGTPNLVYVTTSSEFVIRAINNYGVADRKFYIDINGPTPPIITTSGPKPKIGPSGEDYLINGQIVDFQFTATADILPEGKNIEFFIAEGDGQLPIGLSLSMSGRLYGKIEDDLSIFYQSGTVGNYDREGFDVNPYDHESTQEFGYGGNTQYVNKVYKFYISASNGVGVSKSLYEIDVLDPLSFVKVLNSYPIPPQWLTPTNLGTIRSNSYQNISLETYDCDPGKGTITYEWISANLNNTSVFPPGLELDTTTGVIHGFVGYTPLHSKTYTFNVTVNKTNIISNSSTKRYKRFNLTVLGYSLNPNIEFKTDSILGDIYQGEQSEFNIKAVSVDPNIRITYSLKSGSLPPGLSLASDGAIQGIHTYNTNTLITNNYSVVIGASTSDMSGQIEKMFSINTLPYTGKKYTKIVFRPLLIQSSKQLFSNFINNISVFDPVLLYRPYDSAFGVQSSLEVVLEHGIEQLNLSNYIPAIQNYFYRKKLEFGNIKVAIGSYKNKVLYELIYVEMIDRLINENGDSVQLSIKFDSTIIYPNSIDNMRAALESVAPYNEKLLPKFMNTVQPDTGTPIGRILYMPLCYCLPGASTQMLINIKKYGIDFKKINFEIDRLIVLNSLDNSEAKYLLFPNT